MSKVIDLDDTSKKFRNAAKPPAIVGFIEDFMNGVEAVAQSKNSDGGPLSFQNGGNMHHVKLLKRQAMRIVEEADKMGCDAVSLTWTAGSDFGNFMARHIEESFNEIDRNRQKYAAPGTVVEPVKRIGFNLRMHG